MFIKTEDGNLINTRFVYEITVSDRLPDGTYGVYAYIQMSGNRCLGAYNTKEEAENARDKYFQMK